MRRFLWVAAAALVVAAYSNSLDNSFHFDDAHVIENNAYIRSLASIPRFFTDANTFSSRPANATYRPVVSVTLALDYALGGGLRPRQFHITQVALLLVLGGLMALFYTRLFERSGAAARTAAPAALFAATFFCVQTSNTETLNFIAARSELLAGIGIVSAFLVYLRFPAWRSTGLHLVPMILGALAKVHAVVYAPLLFAYVWVFGEEDQPIARTRRAVAATRPAFVVAGLTYLLIRRMDNPVWDPSGGPVLPYAITQPWVWLHYARLLVLPIGLTADSDWRVFGQWWDPRALAGFAFVAVIAAVFWRTWRSSQARLIAFGLAWFVIALLPTSSVIPFADVMNEHRQFLPFVGLVPAATWAVVLLAKRRLSHSPGFARAALVTLALVVLAANAAGTWQRNKVWRSEESLWLDVTRKSPANGRGLMNYGLARMQQRDLETARQYFEKATMFSPDYPTLIVNLGVVYGALQQPEVAEQHFLRALALSDDADSRYFYGRWLASVGRAPEAADHFGRALAFSPGRIDVRTSLLRLLAAADDAAGLEALARDTIAVDPRHVEAAAYLLGESPCGTPTTALAMQAGLSALGANRTDEAAECFRQVLRLDPLSADGWNNRGWAQLQLGLVPQSVNSFHRALQAAPSDERVKRNLMLAQQRLAR